MDGQFAAGIGKAAAVSAAKYVTSRGHPHAEPCGSAAGLLAGSDVTKLHLQQIGKMISEVGAAAAYARQDLAMCDIEATELHRRIGYLEAQLSASQSEKLTQWRIKAIFRRDVRWRKLSERLAIATARKMLLNSLVESLDARGNLLSREITRRQLESNIDGRSA